MMKGITEKPKKFKNFTDISSNPVGVYLSLEKLKQISATSTSQKLTYATKMVSDKSLVVPLTI